MQHCQSAERSFTLSPGQLAQIQGARARARLQVRCPLPARPRCPPAPAARPPPRPARQRAPPPPRPSRPPAAPAPRPPRPQVSCLLLADAVPLRMHWPLQADLSINGRTYRVTARASAAKLGANQRDEAANVGRRAALGCAAGCVVVVVVVAVLLGCCWAAAGPAAPPPAAGCGHVLL